MTSVSGEGLSSLGTKHDDADGWVGLCKFSEAEPVACRVVVSFDDEEDRDAFLAQIGAVGKDAIHKRTGPTWSLWWPLRSREDLASLRFGSQLDLTGEPLREPRTLPRWPVYVISKGRADTPITANHLKREGVPFRIVVEHQEEKAYARSVGQEYVEVLPFSDLGQGSIPARNWVWEHAKDSGAERHWILDDNIAGFRRLYHGRRIPCAAGPAFWQTEEFVDRYENIGVAGMNYRMFGFPQSPPYRVNCHVYSCLLILNSLPHRWRGRYNEDTDLCLQVLNDGWCTVLFNVFLANKRPTMTMKGGNTEDLYQGDGRLKMAEALVEAWPEHAKVDQRWGRPQHVVEWGQFGASEPTTHAGAQMTIDGGEELIAPKYGSPLKLREDVDLAALATQRIEDGLEIQELQDVRSDRLREIAEEWAT